MLNKLKEIGLEPLKRDKGVPYVTVVIKGDCNDADYEVSKTSFKDGEGLNRLKNLLDLLKKDNNFDIILARGFGTLRDSDEIAEEYGVTEEYLEELHEELMNYVDIPGDDDGLCHTIKSIEFVYTDGDGASIKLAFNKKE